MVFRHSGMTLILAAVAVVESRSSGSPLPQADHSATPTHAVVIVVMIVTHVVVFVFHSFRSN